MADNWIARAEPANYSSGHVPSAGGFLVWGEYGFFGMGSAGGDLDPLVATSRRYHFPTDTWDNFAGTPIGMMRQGPSCCVNYGDYGVYFGATGSTSTTKEVAWLHFPTLTWALGTPLNLDNSGGGLPTSHFYFNTVARLGDYVYVFCRGRTVRYHLPSDTWDTTEAARTVRPGSRDARAPAMPVGDEILLTGGRDSSANPTSIVDAYKPSTDGWRLPTGMPISRYSQGGITTPNEKFSFVVGGSDSLGGTPTHRMRKTSDESWVAKTSIPQSTAEPQLAWWEGRYFAADCSGVDWFLEYVPDVDVTDLEGWGAVS